MTNPSPSIHIRLATPADLPAINDIYNHYVHHSTVTYQVDSETAEARAQWFADHGPLHPVTVAEDAGEIVGWGSLSRFHRRAAYAQTVENSVYVRHDLHRRGIGSAILRDLIDRARAANYRTIIASIDGDQHPSLAIHARFGFIQVAHLKQVGFKFNRWLDVIYLQLML